MKIVRAQKAPQVYVGSMEKGQWFGIPDGIFIVQSASSAGVQAINVRTMETRVFLVTDLVYFYAAITIFLQTQFTVEPNVTEVLPVAEIPALPSRNGRVHHRLEITGK